MRSPEQFDWVDTEGFHPVDYTRWWVACGPVPIPLTEMGEWQSQQDHLTAGLFRWAKEHHELAADRLSPI